MTHKDHLQQEAGLIVVDLLKKNYEIECQIQQVLRFRRIL